MAWFELQLAVTEALREPVINRLFELGAEGINESDPSDSVVVRAFFDEKLRAEVSREITVYLKGLAALFPALPAVKLVFMEVPQEKWAENYKQFYRPQKLSHEFFLQPAWEQSSVVPTGMIPIIMEPGQAFGTGLHPSTKLCIRIIEKAMAFHQPASGIRLLDVGTGTGILAIVAAKLRVGKVVAIDNDPIAVETALENVRLNGCPQIEVSEKPLASFEGTFDIIVSNILLETHKELAADYLRLLPETGQLVLSGLLAPQTQEVDELFQGMGFVFDSSVTLQEWTALGYTRGAKERVPQARTAAVRR